MATLTRLLLIRIVANRRSLSIRRLLIFLSTGRFYSSTSLMSAGLILKNAISLHETNAEQNKSKSPNSNAIIAPIVGVSNVIWEKAVGISWKKAIISNVYLFFVVIKYDTNTYVVLEEPLQRRTYYCMGFCEDFGVSISKASAQTSVT